MISLVADVGGTNARLAIARGGVIDGPSVTRFRGDDYAEFAAVVREYLRRMGDPPIAAACIAVAGPVSQRRARLTNRAWTFDEDHLAQFMNARRVRLINDLTALGYAIPALRDDGIGVLRRPDVVLPGNGQALVVGFGTGYNVCAVRQLSDGICALEAEEGHTRLPVSIYLRLAEQIGAAAAGFHSCEDLLSGRGLVRLHLALHGGATLRGEDIACAAESGTPEALQTYDLLAELAGMLCRELSLRFMPLSGIYLAGSVGRSLAAHAQSFERGFLSEPLMRHIPEATPVSVIRDDMAALHGCLAALN